ncbi:MAG: 1-deoxy-D-xylulose-5-phosphate reductoisomerase [Armatimonadetes bacterium]|nr:1-deoxy-D-xylulose-5-phosphate reductoisomerase [Armatimonadota bacterium]
MQRVAILGSTGSIGRATLDVIAGSPDGLRVTALAARRDVDLLAEQARRFAPSLVVIADEEDVPALRAAVPAATLVLGGPGALEEAAVHPDVDVVVVAVVGIAGLAPTLAAARAGKRIALATKEALVAGGGLVMDAVARDGASLVPLDSEHNALFQCLIGEEPGTVSRLVLTASGGPFLRRPLVSLAHVTPEEALAHPVWRMGPRITVDSATMMNKGFEIIEASWLFGVPASSVDVLIHPQAVVHALVEFVDGSVKTLLAPPDMRLVIHQALHHPRRQPAGFARMTWHNLPPLTFEPPDCERFPCLDLVRDAAACGGTMPAAVNAADEIAVDWFLSGALRFSDIPRLIRRVMDGHRAVSTPVLEDILEADRWARVEALRLAAVLPVPHPMTGA